MKTIKGKINLLYTASAIIFFLPFFYTYIWQIEFYQKWDVYLPFLVIGLIPFVFIAFVYTKPPVAIDDPNETAKGVFFICLFFFLVLQAYGIYYYKLRLQLDGAADMFSYSGLPPEQLPVAPYYRYSYLLNKLLLKPCFQLHLPITVIARIYCLSDAGFYLLIAAAIISLTCRYDYASIVLAAPVLIAGMNFYSIGTELFLSGAIMILYVAVYKHLLDGYMKNLILFICLFFIVWSHPLMLLVLAVFIGGIYGFDKRLIQAKWLLIFILLGVLLRILLLSEYDQNKLVMLNTRLDFGYWSYIGKQYLKEFWYLAIISAAAGFIAVKQKNIAAYKGFLVVPILLYYCNERKLSVTDPYFAKFFYPVHLFLCTQGILVSVQYYNRHKKLIWTISAIILLGGAYNLLSKYHLELMQRTILMEKINFLCYKEDPQQSKWFVREDSLRGLDWGAKHYESISFSAYQNFATAIQVVRGNSVTKRYLESVPADEFSIEEKITSSTKVLNSYYYRFYNGRYKELLLDSAKLEFLKKR